MNIGVLITSEWIVLIGALLNVNTVNNLGWFTSNGLWGQKIGKTS